MLKIRSQNKCKSVSPHGFICNIICFRAKTKYVQFYNSDVSLLR